MFEKVKDVLSKWWIALVLGILFIVGGVFLLGNPGAAVESLSWILVVFFITSGILSIVYVLKNKDTIPAWGWDLAAAILTTVLGFVVLFRPLMKESLLVGIYAAAILFAGINGITNSISMKKLKVKSWWVLLIAGILMVVAAFMVAANPIVGLLSIGIWVGMSVIFKGVELIATAIALSKAKGVVDNAEKQVNAAAEEIRKQYAEAEKKVEKAVEEYAAAEQKENK